jgi:large subunit ribosomal protein L24
MNLKKGDKVIIITGKDKGKSGTIERALPTENKVLIAGVNVHKYHQKPRRAGDKGQTVDKHMPIHVSNVMLVDSGTGKRTRVTRKVVDGKKVRIAKKSGNAI